MGYYIQSMGLEHQVRKQAYRHSYMVTLNMVGAYHYIIMVGARDYLVHY
jgi:hypothetical protein